MFHLSIDLLFLAVNFILSIEFVVLSLNFGVFLSFSDLLVDSFKFGFELFFRILFDFSLFIRNIIVYFFSNLALLVRKVSVLFSLEVLEFLLKLLTDVFFVVLES